MKISLEIHWRAVLRFVLGLVLLWAALGKLADLQAFHTQLLAYRLPLPGLLLQLVAIVLPWLELLCGLLLASNAQSRAALAWAFVLFTIFVLCTGQAWLRGLSIDCGCLNLSLIGLPPGTPAATFLESPAFACVRAFILAAVTFGLLRQEGTPG